MIIIQIQQVQAANLADQLVNSALRYRGQAPLVEAILKEIGITGGDINGLTAAIKPEPDPPTSKGKWFWVLELSKASCRN
jgi:hypothetical protein